MGFFHQDVALIITNYLVQVTLKPLKQPQRVVHGSCDGHYQGGEWFFENGCMWIDFCTLTFPCYYLLSVTDRQTSLLDLLISIT